MVIQNSLLLLKDLSRLETKIKSLEMKLKLENPQLDIEEILKTILINQIN